MDYLLNSRLDRSESPLKLDHLSPEKFGKSAYASLSYTPSKLASNVLFKEVSSMRKVEESSSKAREWEALNNFLKDKLKHLQEEKEGIEQTLTQQIAMYKRMISEMETTHEKRIRALQTFFNEEIQKIILIKEEEAKYVQSEKELLENRIYELEEVIASLKGQLEDQANSNQTAEKQIEQLKQELANMHDQNQQLVQKLNGEVEKRQKDRQEFNKHKGLLEAQFRQRFSQKESEFNSKMDHIKTSHEEQLRTIQNQRLRSSQAKEERLRELKSNFEAESRRLNEAIQSKDQMIKHLNESLKEEKEKMVDLIKQYTNQITNLTNEKKKLLEQASQAKEALKKYEDNSTQTTANLQATIDKLKKEAEELKKQIELLVFDNEDMRREILILRKNVQKTSYLLEENSIMSKELKNLKDLLMESSLEMERCKGEFMRLDKEKELLMGKMRELDMQNETLYRIKLDMEEEARIWRQTYYMNRR